MGIGEIGEKLRRSTVQVRGSGSGVIWDASGAIVTNAHVVGSLGIGSEDLDVEFWNGRTARVRLDRRDLRRDLAILRLNPGGMGAGTIEPANPGDSSRVRIGELVIAVGNPFGFTGALSTGVVHGVGPVRHLGNGLGRQEFIHTTARLAPGNSGGPLADASGNIVGINTMVTSGGLGLAVPSNAVRRLLAAGPPVELGVTIRPVRIPGSECGIALLVLEIAPDSPAEYASLRVGDLLIGSSGRRFASIDDFREALEQGNGNSITLQFLRGDLRQREVVIRLMHAAAA